MFQDDKIWFKIIENEILLDHITSYSYDDADYFCICWECHLLATSSTADKRLKKSELFYLYSIIDSDV